MIKHYWCDRLLRNVTRKGFDKMGVKKKEYYIFFSKIILFLFFSLLRLVLRIGLSSLEEEKAQLLCRFPHLHWCILAWLQSLQSVTLNDSHLLYMTLSLSQSELIDRFRNNQSHQECSITNSSTVSYCFGRDSEPRVLVL